MNKITKEFLESEIANVQYQRLHGTLTHCTIITKDGFSFTGESACVDPTNFKQELGEKYAYEQAFEKMWMPYGFWLHKKLANEPKDWLDRVCIENSELTDKIEKLKAFLAGDKPKFVAEAQWVLMHEQLKHMAHYKNVLLSRLSEANGIVE